MVNKFSYHFRRPKRGEVFVFNTRGISGITLDNQAQGSQHYIKRLCGVPGDTLGIEKDDPRLYVDGEPAKDAMIERVWADEEAGYRGYMFVPGVPPEWMHGEHSASRRSYPLADGEYMALGDNSYNSSDSRMWGVVPEQNLVGPALFVYWPFEHWGRIR
mgnify:FL=1